MTDFDAVDAGNAETIAILAAALEHCRSANEWDWFTSDWAGEPSRSIAERIADLEASR